MEEDLQKKKGLWKRLVTSLDWALKRMSEEEVSEERNKTSKSRSWEGNSKMRVLSGVCYVAHSWEQGKYHGYLGKLCFFFFPQELCKNGISGCWRVCPSVSLINHSDVPPEKHWSVRGHISRVKKILTCDLSMCLLIKTLKRKMRAHL